MQRLRSSGLFLHPMLREARSLPPLYLLGSSGILLQILEFFPVETQWAVSSTKNITNHVETYAYILLLFVSSISSSFSLFGSIRSLLAVQGRACFLIYCGIDCDIQPARLLLIAKVPGNSTYQPCSPSLSGRRRYRYIFGSLVLLYLGGAY